MGTGDGPGSTASEGSRTARWHLSILYLPKGALEKAQITGSQSSVMCSLHSHCPQAGGRQSYCHFSSAIFFSMFLPTCCFRSCAYSTLIFLACWSASKAGTLCPSLPAAVPVLSWVPSWCTSVGSGPGSHDKWSASAGRMLLISPRDVSLTVKAPSDGNSTPSPGNPYQSFIIHPARQAFQILP